MKLKKILLICFVSAYLLVMGLNIPITSTAQEPNKIASDVTWTLKNSDPKVLGWMEGSPPPPDKIIRFADGSYFNVPQMRWSVCNFQELMPTKSVSRALFSTVPLEKEELLVSNKLFLKR